MKPVIDILIPARNAEKYLRLTIESVLLEKSDQYDLRIVLSNNHSTDNTLRIIKEFQSQIEVIQPPSLLGIANHWNYISSQAKGDFVKLLCADDLITRGGIARQLQVLTQNEGVSVVASRRSIIDSRGRPLLKSHGIPLPEGIYSGRYLLEKCWRKGTNILGEPGALMFRKNSFLQGLPWSDNIPYLLDMSHYIDSLANNDVHVLHSIDFAFRYHPSSLSSSLSSLQAKSFRDFFRSVNGHVRNCKCLDCRKVYVNALKSQLMRASFSLFSKVK